MKDSIEAGFGQVKNPEKPKYLLRTSITWIL